jgi:hypothetical protein
VDETLPLLESSFFSSRSLYFSSPFSSLSIEFCESASGHSQIHPNSVAFIESIQISMLYDLENSLMKAEIAATSPAQQNIESTFIYSTGFWLVIGASILVLCGVIAFLIVYRGRVLWQTEYETVTDEELDDTANFLNSLKREDSAVLNLDCENPLSDPAAIVTVSMEPEVIGSSETDVVDDEDETSNGAKCK